jgi:hypothetical protein
MNQKKLMTTAENMDKFVKIMAGFMNAAAIICTIFAALILIFGEAMFATGSTTLDLDFVKLHLSPEYQEITTMVQVYVLIGLIAGAIMLFGIYKGLGYLRNILEPMKTGRLFEKNVADNLKKIAWIVLLVGAVTQISAVVERILLTKVYPMEEIFASASIEKIEYAYTMDFGFVLVFAILMFLSYIFDYGQKLQQESDETL